MKSQDIIMINSKEIKKLHLVKMHIEGRLKQKEAAEILSLTTRQIRRIAAKIKREGDKAVAHKLRARPSNSSKDIKLKEKVITIYRKKYSDFGPTLAKEKLLEDENISLGKETLRLWLIEEGIHQKRRKARPHRMQRKRKANFGQMTGLDGSNHAWFEDRADKACLMGYIDDATNNVFGRFYSYEGTIPALDSFRRYAYAYGIPESMYMDKHSTYRSTAKPTIEEELCGKESFSQFGRTLGELGVDIIYANSPQAKGRIERLFKTLQDRLVKEFRLFGIDSIKDANIFLEDYLPKFNLKFSIPSLGGSNLHRKPHKNLDSILCIKDRRRLRNDNTISFEKKFYQILFPVVCKKVDT